MQQAEPQDVVLVFVHGVNTACQDYYVPMRELLLKALPRETRKHVIFRAVFWADIVRGRQQEYLHYARETPGFAPGSMHQLVIEGLGDAAAYQKTRARRNSAYYEIQERVRKAIRDTCLGPQDRRPLVLIDHSLGCHILSTYTWDLNKAKQGIFDDESADGNDRAYYDHLVNAHHFERLETLAGIVTMGSNMPLFTFTFGPQYVHPISQSPQASDPSAMATAAFPGIELDAETRDAARWLNFFSTNDPLGYPLKPLNDAYDNEQRLTDTCVRSEGWRGGITPKFLRPLLANRAHTGYWTSRVIAGDVARMVTKIVQAPLKRAKAPVAGPAGPGTSIKVAPPLATHDHAEGGRHG